MSTLDLLNIPVTNISLLISIKSFLFLTYVFPLMIVLHVFQQVIVLQYSFRFLFLDEFGLECQRTFGQHKNPFE